MNILIFSQSLYYLVVSGAILVIGIMLAIVIYHIIYIVKNLHDVSDNISEASKETLERIEAVIEKLSHMPILSFFLKKNEAKKNGSKKSAGK